MNVVQEIVMWALPILFAVTFHEVAHGWMALRCGDSTAKLAGRLSLNPLNHVDLIGTIIVPITMLMLSGIIFGWAKPVPVNWRYLKRPKRDMALVAMAGPLANLVMAILWAGIAKLGFIFIDSFQAATAMIYIGKSGISINLLLLVFNLFPIPPLDGSKVAMSLLPSNLAWEYSKLEPYGFFILLIMIMLGINNLIFPPMLFLQGLIFQLYGL